MKIKKSNRSHIYKLGLDMNTNILNIKIVVVCWCLYVSSST